MPFLHIPASLRAHADQKAVVEIDGGTVGEILRQLANQYPELAASLMNESYQLHPFISLYVNGQNIRDLEDRETPIAQSQSLLIVPALAGG
jgi:sulfur-carrier protein